MANNPYVNRVDYDGRTLIDISDTSAEASDVLPGKVFYTASGARSVGTASVPQELNDLDDVTITNPQQGEVLVYDGTNQIWYNANLTQPMSNVINMLSELGLDTTTVLQPAMLDVSEIGRSVVQRGVD